MVAYHVWIRTFNFSWDCTCCGGKSGASITSSWFVYRSSTWQFSHPLHTPSLVSSKETSSPQIVHTLHSSPHSPTAHEQPLHRSILHPSTSLFCKKVADPSWNNPPDQILFSLFLVDCSTLLFLLWFWALEITQKLVLHLLSRQDTIFQIYVASWEDG